MRYRSLSTKFSKLTTSLLSTPLSYCKGEPMNSLARLRASGRISCRTLLGLEQFSRLQEKARQRARGFDERAALREADLKWYQAEISSKAQYESALASAVAEVSRLEKLMAGQATEIERLDALALEERLARTERSRLLNDQRGMEASRQDARTQLDFARQRLTDLEAVTAREREIRANFEQYERLSRRRDELVSQIGELAGLQEELADGQRRVDQIRNEQVRRISNLESQRKAYRGQMSAGAEAMSRLEELIPREERLNSLRAELAEMLEQKTATAAERQASLTNVRNLESSQQDLTGRIQILDREGAECPVCRQPLGDDLREDVKMQARKEWRELNDVKLDLESSIRDLKKHAERIDKTMRQTEGELKAGEELTRQVVKLQTTLQQSREAEERFKSLTGELSSLETEFRGRKRVEGTRRLAKASPGESRPNGCAPRRLGPHARWVVPGRSGAGGTREAAGGARGTSRSAGPGCTRGSTARRFRPTGRRGGQSHR